jgi:hypothetical protein
MRKSALMAAVLVITTIGVAGTAAASPIRKCGRIRDVHGSPAGVFNLTTRRVACRYARRFAVQVTEHFPFPRHWAGFACREYFFNQGLVRHSLRKRCSGPPLARR